MTRQAALLLALGALATAAALVSFGSWLLLRRGRSDRPAHPHPTADDEAPAPPESGLIAD